MMKGRTYLRIFFGLTAGILLSTAVFCRVMNPYSIYRGPVIEGVNKLKPEFARHIRLAKAWAVYERKPESISLGSSRVEYGLRPEHPAWGGDQVYNLGVSSANMYEVLRYFQHADAIHPQNKVVLGLDLYMFNALVKPQDDFSETRMAAKPDGSLNKEFTILEKFSTLFSIDALKAGIETLGEQDYEEFTRALYMPNGQIDIPHRRMMMAKEMGGCHNAFKRAVAYYLEHGVGEREFSFSDDSGYSPFDDFETLIETAYRRNINLHIYISPSHAYYCEVLHHLDLWPVFEEWKRRLVRANEEWAEKLGREPFTIWDFSGYNSITTEEVPPEGDSESEMKWYLEISHYSDDAGDVILQRLLGDDSDQTQIPNDFGTPLTSGSIDDVLRATREAGEAYRAKYPGLGELIKSL